MKNTCRETMYKGKMDVTYTALLQKITLESPLFLDKM
jgi:hypothetical protein